jgi:hypothetical protein
VIFGPPPIEGSPTRPMRAQCTHIRDAVVSRPGPIRESLKWGIAGRGLQSEQSRTRSATQEIPLSIPALDPHGLLPAGVHDCTLHDIGTAFAWNAHRSTLLKAFQDCYQREIRASFSQPLLFDGSFVTDKEIPDDIDVVLDLSTASAQAQVNGVKYLVQNQDRLRAQYRVHFWINLPGLTGDFSSFFQYLGGKTAKLKGLQPKHHKGILRLT